MEKLDFKKRDKAYYAGKVGRFDRLEVPPMNYLMIDGEGGPVGESYPPSLAALYGLSYGLKFLSKTELEKDFVVGPLQGLWWAEDMNTFITRQKDQWLWTMMIRQPEWLTQDHLEQVRAQTIAKNAKKKEPPTSEALLRIVRLETYKEGDCVQVLHVGSYDDEGPILHKMHHEYIPEQGLKMYMKHHEIYLNDPRRVAPEKLKTILRQPVRPV
ncbi:GyrI-like domain-containing protein [Maritalea mediterranea]|uniref:GyrI-like domain-containing protein n=1 Tax=Maritalea mediterranea TaxID=2909667 RepID=A0ABS9ECD7_9HYPH|nr:GyrI-like domain-containing protein [Maritalea mediterranea]MCF4099121.1 GyrI-like domain-containing protein [Maritalea mediterranea]